MSESTQTSSLRISHYQLIQEVGSGGLGKVYLALDTRTNSRVAVKVLHDRFVNDRKILGIFHRELLIMSRLEHKHLVKYLDSIFQPPVCVIISEFIEGFSGSALIRRAKKLPPLVAVSIIFDILQAIDYLHLHDTVHADLSAANYLVERSGRVLVTDFGLAAQKEIEDYKNFRIGTPGYYSPEHITETAIVPASDLYCTGLLLFELLTGQKAVPAARDRREVLRNMRRINLKMVVSSDRRMQSMLRKILKTALHPNPNRRFQLAEEMIFKCFEILKLHNIRYSKFAIRQCLVQMGLIEGNLPKVEQDIYQGFVRRD